VIVIAEIAMSQESEFSDFPDWMASKSVSRMAASSSSRFATWLTRSMSKPTGFPPFTYSKGS